MSDFCVGTESIKPNLLGTKSSGAINVVLPPSNRTLHDNGWLGSRTIVINPKSARQARGGVSLDMRMFACYTLERGSFCEARRH